VLEDDHISIWPDHERATDEERWSRRTDA
jgi:hypothetical protein